jgi:hypothetical protein
MESEGSLYKSLPLAPHPEPDERSPYHPFVD